MWLSWRAATERALYGEKGFYLRERPSGHFRTSVSASAAFAEAVLTLLRQVDAELGAPEELDLVDIGAGEGALMTGVLAAAEPALRDRLRVTAVDLSPRPHGLPEQIAWRKGLPDRISGLAIANEWLDNIPLDVAEQTPDGPRLVLVDLRTGEERLGGPLRPADREWLDRWWPLPRVGSRAEIGRPRDEAWASVVTRLTSGRAIAIDYAHPVDNRPLCGTLTGYRDGAVVAPIPDGTCDITAHVALDACAEAGRRAGAISTTLSTQRDALRALGITGVRPPMELAGTDPRAYLRALARASEEGELIDPSGLGSFGWLDQRR
ncbi:SAM-dependent MidA family methyltransferase [Nonomuraea polychroma]|uniref:SAM-dependent MidA family methyltransferase n=1 Tax=Nonomuraea polychroma TaxID=46176 RepID=A0A438MJI3_9ACTN|nr:SAM-dependent methyltransferase [Nonomuraea polychroma]RVX45706.1 SAM-dependent MidA family methyltransferase [Nonomuraea polychroma]